MKKQWKVLIFCILLPLAVGGAASLLSNNGMEMFAQINQPSLSPPDDVFPVVWTILYTLMGISSYLILTSEEEDIKKAGMLYGYQLVVNFLWPTFFFNFQWYLFSFLWLLLLILLVVAMIR